MMMILNMLKISLISMMMILNMLKKSLITMMINPRRRKEMEKERNQRKVKKSQLKKKIS